MAGVRRKSPSGLLPHILSTSTQCVHTYLSPECDHIAATRHRLNDGAQPLGPQRQRLTHLGFISVLVIDPLQALLTVAQDHLSDVVGYPQRGQVRPRSPPRVMNNPGLELNRARVVTPHPRH